MSVGYAAVAARPVGERVRRTIALLDRRGYAVSPRRLSELCLGGPVAEADVRWAVAADAELAIAEDLVVQRSALGRAADIRSRSAAHSHQSAAYVGLAVEFIRTLVSVAPFITSVSIAGSLASGGVCQIPGADLDPLGGGGPPPPHYLVGKGPGTPYP